MKTVKGSPYDKAEGFIGVNRERLDVQGKWIVKLEQRLYRQEKLNLVLGVFTLLLFGLLFGLLMYARLRGYL